MGSKNQTPQRRQRAELTSTSIKGVLKTPGPAKGFFRTEDVNPPAQQRMEAKQFAESGANHARHHVSRKTQS